MTYYNLADALKQAAILNSERKRFSDPVWVVTSKKAGIYKLVLEY